MCGCPGQAGKRDVFCRHNLYKDYLFYFSYPMYISVDSVINLNAFDVALMFIHVFKLLSLW